MSRISTEALARALLKVRIMDLGEKEQLAGELFRAQPHVLASFLVQPRLGVSMEKADFLIELVLVCFQAMKESGLPWPLITEDEQERQLGRLVGSIKFSEDLPADLRSRAMMRYIEEHPEKELFAFIYHEAMNWLRGVEPEESDKYVVLAALNLVNCIAFVPMPGATASTAATP